MDFPGGLYYSFDYNEDLSQRFYVGFPCGIELNNVQDIEFRQVQIEKGVYYS